MSPSNHEIVRNNLIRCKGVIEDLKLAVNEILKATNFDEISNLNQFCDDKNADEKKFFDLIVALRLDVQAAIKSSEEVVKTINRIARWMLEKMERGDESMDRLNLVENMYEKELDKLQGKIIDSVKKFESAAEKVLDIKLRINQIIQSIGNEVKKLENKKDQKKETTKSMIYHGTATVTLSKIFHFFHQN